jgi:hypothetical protein
MNGMQSRSLLRAGHVGRAGSAPAAGHAGGGPVADYAVPLSAANAKRAYSCSTPSK